MQYISFTASVQLQATSRPLELELEKNPAYNSPFKMLAGYSNLEPSKFSLLVLLFKYEEDQWLRSHFSTLQELVHVSQNASRP